MLSDFMSELATDLGLTIAVPAERQYLLDKINKAAADLYNSNLLRGCEMEQVFELDVAAQQVSLPSYVGRVLNVRHHLLRAPINVESLRPRYVQQQWVPPYLNWRVKSFSAPLARVTGQVAPLTFTLPEPATEAFVVTVAGKTIDSAHKVETVAFTIGDTTKSTAGAYYQEEIKYIKKSREIEFDLSVTDIDGTEIAVMDNNKLSTAYMVVNVLDWLYEYQSPDGKFVEVLFKPRFVPYVEDTDIFTGGEQYERAVYYKTMRYMLEKQEGKENDALLAEQACMKHINEIANDQKSSETAKLKYQMPIIYQFKFLSRTWAYRPTGLRGRGL